MDKMSVCDERNNNIILKKGTSQKGTVIYEAIPLSQSKCLRFHGLKPKQTQTELKTQLHLPSTYIDVKPLLAFIHCSCRFVSFDLIANLYSGCLWD